MQEKEKIKNGFDGLSPMSAGRNQEMFLSSMFNTDRISNGHDGFTQS